MRDGRPDTNWTEQCLGAMHAAVGSLGQRAPLLTEMAEYHLGWANGTGEQNSNRGKMIRPLVAVESCRAASDRSDDAAAIPLAAAIELLHNFTLVHDDIQDNSPTRRHRPTVWAKWGEAQAINAGDALFAAAHLALLGGRDRIDSEPMLTLIDLFERTTIEIVAGQVLDLQFEARTDVTAEEYITMISGKTAAIVEFAARGGAMVSGAKADVVEAFSRFGLALGLGFQVQDDLLGVFGSESVTGKAAADDIRRRKQSLPMILLRQRIDRRDRTNLGELYAETEIDAMAVGKVLGLMERYGVEAEVREQVMAYHDEADAALRSSGLSDRSCAPLRQLVERLSQRDF